MENKSAYNNGFHIMAGYYSRLEQHHNLNDFYMSKLFTIFLFIAFSLNCNSQNTELLKGKWVFKKALNKGVDALGKETLKNDIINKMTFDFKSNGDFVAFAFGEKMHGTWLLSKDSKVIILATEKEKHNFSIMELNPKQLILKVGLGEFLMEKM